MLTLVVGICLRLTERLERRFRPGSWDIAEGGGNRGFIDGITCLSWHALPDCRRHPLLALGDAIAMAASAPDVH